MVVGELIDFGGGEAEFILKDGAGVFTEAGGRADDAGGGLGEMGDRAKLGDSGRTGAGNGLEHVAGGDLRVVEGGGDVVDGADGDALRTDQVDPLGGGTAAKDFFPEGDEDVAVMDATGVGLETGVVPEVEAVGNLAEAVILLVVADTEAEIAVGGLEDLIGNNVGMGVAIAGGGLTGDKVVLGDVDEPR